MTTRWFVCLAVGFLAATGTASAKRKNDSVVIMNGDRLVGEIKGLSEGELRFETDYILDEFHIDWSQVRQLQRLDTFRVDLRDGRRITGTIERRDGGHFVIENDDSNPPGNANKNDFGVTNSIGWKF
jgi:hypothetical protein